MSIHASTVLTAGLLSVLLAAGSFASVQAGESCEKGKKKGESTSTLWSPAAADIDQSSVASSACP